MLPIYEAGILIFVCTVPRNVVLILESLMIVYKLLWYFDTVAANQNIFVYDRVNTDLRFLWPVRIIFVKRGIAEIKRWLVEQLWAEIKCGLYFSWKLCLFTIQSMNDLSLLNNRVWRGVLQMNLLVVSETDLRRFVSLNYSLFYASSFHREVNH